MQTYLLVFIGGGLGSMCRYGLAQLLSRQSAHFPWATLGANVLSCILLGALLGLSLRSGVASSTRLLVMTGFCGGFSTFSTFTAETYQLLLAGQPGYALANVAASLLLCLACIFAGMQLTS